MTGTTCEVCLTCFHTRHRLLMHLRGAGGRTAANRTTRCLEGYRLLDLHAPTDPELVAAAEARGLDETAELKRQGLRRYAADVPTLRLEGPHQATAYHLGLSHSTLWAGVPRVRCSAAALAALSLPDVEHLMAQRRRCTGRKVSYSRRTRRAALLDPRGAAAAVRAARAGSRPERRVRGKRSDATVPWVPQTRFLVPGLHRLKAKVSDPRIPPTGRYRVTGKQPPPCRGTVPLPPPLFVATGGTVDGHRLPVGPTIFGGPESRDWAADWGVPSGPVGTLAGPPAPPSAPPLAATVQRDSSAGDPGDPPPGGGSFPPAGPSSVSEDPYPEADRVLGPTRMGRGSRGPQYPAQSPGRESQGFPGVGEDPEEGGAPFSGDTPGPHPRPRPRLCPRRRVAPRWRTPPRRGRTLPTGVAPIAPLRRPLGPLTVRRTTCMSLHLNAQKRLPLRLTRPGPGPRCPMDPRRPP